MARRSISDKSIRALTSTVAEHRRFRANSASRARRLHAPVLGSSRVSQSAASTPAREESANHGISRPGHLGSRGAPAPPLHGRRSGGDGRGRRDGGGRARRADRGGAGPDVAEGKSSRDRQNRSGRPLESGATQELHGCAGNDFPSERGHLSRARRRHLSPRNRPCRLVRHGRAARRRDRRFPRSGTTLGGRRRSTPASAFASSGSSMRFD